MWKKLVALPVVAVMAFGVVEGCGGSRRYACADPLELTVLVTKTGGGGGSSGAPSYSGSHSAPAKVTPAAPAKPAPAAPAAPAKPAPAAPAKPAPAFNGSKAGAASQAPAFNGARSTGNGAFTATPKPGGQVPAFNGSRVSSRSFSYGGTTFYPHSRSYYTYQINPYDPYDYRNFSNPFSPFYGVQLASVACR